MNRPAAGFGSVVRHRGAGLRPPWRSRISVAIPDCFAASPLAMTEAVKTYGRWYYFFAPGAPPGFSFANGEAGAAAFDFSALGFFASRLLLF